MLLNFEHVREYTPRLDLASIGDVIAMGYGRYQIAVVTNP